MNSTLRPEIVRRPLAPQRLAAIFKKTLSLGEDLDGRGLHWRLPHEVSPERRLAFALAVYCTGGLSVLIAADRGFLCVERIARQFAQWQKARQSDACLAGQAFARLHDALGYAHHETVGFRLVRDAGLRSAEGFIKGFADAVAQSLEADVMRVIRGSATAGNEVLINNLRHFIGDHMAVATLARDII